MFALLKKEISTFFSSLTGYLVIVVFLTVVGLYMWIFPGEMNIFDVGYSSIDTLFAIAPWVFLFLVPAVTMRLFAEEKRTGTLESLLTKPLTDFQIVMAKYLSGLFLVLLALVPTLIYFISVQFFLSDGNMDVGGTFGSYIGLFFLAAIYVAIGVFSSSITNNQVVAFVVGVISAFFFYIGFEYITQIGIEGVLASIIDYFGINSHYNSISRGVVDTRDIIYFLSAISLFIFLTQFVLERRKTAKRKNIIRLVAVLLIIIVINLISSFTFTRADLTAEKRYTLTDYTKKSLKNLDGQIFITVYLDGDDLPLQFKKFRNSVKELLSVFKVYSSQNLNYEFVNPTDESKSKNDRDLLYKELHNLGIVPIESSETNEGQATQTLIFPSAVITYTFYDTKRDSLVTRRVGLNLLNNDPNFEQTSPENINNSVQGLEYAFVNEIVKLNKKTKPRIAFIEGHGELSQPYTIEMRKLLNEYYHVQGGEILGEYGVLDNFKAIIIAKPTSEFSKADKFVIDQYIMNGGKVLWLVDGVNVSMDSIYYYERSFAMPALTQSLKIDDQLFTYGVRINTDILQDAYSSSILLKGTSSTGEVRDHRYQWLYFPLLVTQNNHVINKYLDVIKTEFVSSIDTVGKNPEIKKTVLLTTSNMTRKIVVNMPLEVNFKEINDVPDQKLFTAKNLPVAFLLEGKFPSLFKGRMINNLIPNKSLFKDKSVDTKMIVVADGDIIKNVVKSDGETLPVSFDKYSLYNYYGNQQFIMNALNYLCDDEGLMSLRSREFKLRLLDQTIVEKQKSLWQIFNLFVPIAVIVLIGLVLYFVRKRKYTKIK